MNMQLLSYVKDGNGKLKCLNNCVLAIFRPKIENPASARASGSFWSKIVT